MVKSIILKRIKTKKMNFNYTDIKGLSDEQVILAREKFGQNKVVYKGNNEFFKFILRTAKDPMIILLLTASSIYFISGKMDDGAFVAVAVILQTSISLYQHVKSENALKKLKDFSQPYSKVIRNGIVVEIKSEHIVIGDSLMVEEGTSISADGTILHSNDFSVNQSILTGESFPVFKDHSTEDKFIYSGTTVTTGLAIATITAIGNQTKLGKIGKSLESITEQKTPLEIQISNFVKKMAMTGGGIFALVWFIHYWHSAHLLNSLLQSLTLAMSILPEEIPVAFTAFMALGAWRLMKTGIVVKQMKTVEALGSATVICTDKTGTITENQMSLAKLFVLSSNTISQPNNVLTDEEKELLVFAMWASEPIPFDPMEVALHQTYKDIVDNDERLDYKIVHEYPLSGTPPMMTHVFENQKKNRIIAAKGAPEALIIASEMTEIERHQIKTAIESLGNDGYRVLGVGISHFQGSKYPSKQQDLSFKFKGLIAFYDPPKKNIQKVLENFYDAGIAVKIITGDNAATTVALAKQIGFRGYEKSMTGEELMNLSEHESKICIMNTMIFTRMFPDAKLRIINALKSDGHIVAMIGDGVNDGPALKAAHIGISMGKKGTEIAKQAASLILLEDDLSKMVDAVAMGRKIYTNFKKATQYIISIHIPIILTVCIPLALGWVYPNIFSPIHIIFLELIMGPTCSIVYENEPMEKNTMKQKPKALTSTFFSWKELSTSIIQGLVITVGSLFVYQYSVINNYNEALTRSMTFTVLVIANIFLTLTNRSFYYSILTTLKYKNNLVVFVILTVIIIMGLIFSIKSVTTFFEFETLNFSQLSMCMIIGFVSVVWFEIVKWYRRTQLLYINTSRNSDNAFENN